jgi:hypothetical protein
MVYRNVASVAQEKRESKNEGLSHDVDENKGKLK